jgi:hypothetical protein
METKIRAGTGTGARHRQDFPSSGRKTEAQQPKVNNVFDAILSRGSRDSQL